MRNQSLGTTYVFHLSPFPHQETEAWRREGTFRQSFAKYVSMAYQRREFRFPTFSPASFTVLPAASWEFHSRQVLFLCA